MSSAFNEVYDKFLSFTHQERINCAVNGTAKVYTYLKEQGADDEFAGSFFAVLIGLFIGADGQITANEASVFNEVFGTNFTPSDLVDYISQVTNEENYKAVNEIVDRMDEDTKFAACVIVLAVIAADGDINNTEAALFEELWA